MKVRIKFQKFGAMKFIGHLDVMRYFQKAFRRAGIDNEYSKGFSPHQIMSFAAPLGVGLTSDGEYLDAQLLSGDAPQVMIDRINEALTEGFKITGFKELKDREENKKAVTAMSLVASADYLVSLRDGYQICGEIRTKEAFQSAFTKFLSGDRIVMDKKTKKSETQVDIKPMISFASFDEEEYISKLKLTLSEPSQAEPIKASLLSSTADQYENGIRVFLQVETGSSSNLKPELVMEAFYDSLGIEYEKYAWQVHRLEVYAREEDAGLMALDQLER